jgi:hypothetical protein
MIPARRHQIGVSDVVQFTGLMVLIGFIYRNFGPDAPGPVTPSAVAVLVAGVVLLLWPMRLKSRN